MLAQGSLEIRGTGKEVEGDFNVQVGAGSFQWVVLGPQVNMTP